MATWMDLVHFKQSEINQTEKDKIHHLYAESEKKSWTHRNQVKNADC